MHKLRGKLPAIKRTLSSSDKVYTRPALFELFHDNKMAWKLSDTFSSERLLRVLLEESLLQKIILTSESYKPITRYTHQDPSPYSIALSLKAGSYLSHATAVFLHGLTDLMPRRIYVNKEQSEKPLPTQRPSQESINRAFSNKQRESQYVYNYKEFQIVILSGKQTGGLGVQRLQVNGSQPLSVTNLPRTLIDIAVRPNYAGGIFQVLKAYKEAKEKVSVSDVLTTLKKLKYQYPYHQAIGFYMTRAGYSAAEVAKLKKIGIQFQFYLDYGTKERDRAYDKEWNLFFPKGL